MAYLRGEPYRLAKGMLIKVIARAFNLYEWGPYSEVNSEGATIETEPIGIVTLSFLDTPAASNNNQVTLQWTPITSDSDIGGSPLLDYRVYAKVSTEAAFALLTLVTPDQSSYIATGLTSGVTYSYFIVARNAHGESSHATSLVLNYLAS